MNLTTLQKEGWQGCDSLRISLTEYGFIYRETAQGWEVIHRHPAIQGAFTQTTLKKDTDPKKEWSWINWEELGKTIGLSAEDLLKLPLPEIAEHVLRNSGEIGNSNPNPLYIEGLDGLPENFSTEAGYLTIAGAKVDGEEADRLALAFGFNHGDHLIKHLEKRNLTPHQS